MARFVGHDEALRLQGQSEAAEEFRHLLAARDAEILSAVTERDEARAEVERLKAAGNTMSAYIYSISQPASIPAVIRQAMQVLASGKAD